MQIKHIGNERKNVMEQIVLDIKKALGGNDDFFIKRDYLLKKEVLLLGLSTLVDMTKTKTILQKQSEGLISQGKTSESIFILMGELFEDDTKKAITSVLEGKLILYIEHSKKFIIYEPVP